MVVGFAGTTEEVKCCVATSELFLHVIHSSAKPYI